jgi:hypothetical protein
MHALTKAQANDVVPFLGISGFLSQNLILAKPPVMSSARRGKGRDGRGGGTQNCNTACTRLRHVGVTRLAAAELMRRQGAQREKREMQDACWLHWAGDRKVGARQTWRPGLGPVSWLPAVCS